MSKCNRLNHKILSIVVICLCVLSAISIGFSSWNIGASYTAEANMELIADDVTGNFVQFKDIKIYNNVIRFDAKEDIYGNVTMGKDGKQEQLECKIVGTIEKYSTLKEVNAYVSADSHYEQTWNSIYKKGYFEVPRFMTLSRTSSNEDSLEDVCSYWTSDYDSSKNSRSFCMRSSFTWGKFFNYMNPCDFFDSYDSNGIKRGIEYTQQEKKTILKELKTLNGSKFIVELRSKPITYEVYVDYDDGTHGIQTLDNAEKNGVLYFPDSPSDEYSPAGGTFIGWKIEGINSDKIYQASETINIESLPLENTNEITLKAQWDFSVEILAKSMTITVTGSGEGSGTSNEQTHDSIDIKLGNSGGTLTFTPNFEPNNVSNPNISIINQSDKTNTGKYSISGNSIVVSKNDDSSEKYIYIKIASSANASMYVNVNITIEKSCLLPDSIVLMADGTYKQAGLIEVGDMVMIFNHEKGQIESAPILFNFTYEEKTVEVLDLNFDDEIIKISGDHGFFDLNLNKYVYINTNNVSDYVGHTFVSVNNNKLTYKTLQKFSIKKQLTKLYCPVSVFHLNYFVGSMLSMPGGIDGCFNIFEYDNTLKYDSVKMQSDIKEYGLMTYEECQDFIPRNIFDSLPMKYMRVAIGKGILTKEQLEFYMQHFYSLMK